MEPAYRQFIPKAARLIGSRTAFVVALVVSGVVGHERSMRSDAREKCWPAARRVVHDA